MSLIIILKESLKMTKHIFNILVFTVLVYFAQSSENPYIGQIKLAQTSEIVCNLNCIQKYGLYQNNQKSLILKIASYNLLS